MSDGFIYGYIANNYSRFAHRARECISPGSCLMRNEESNVNDDARDICGSETSNKLCAVPSSVESVSNNKPSTCEPSFPIIH